jgi:hypothetical protein
LEARILGAIASAFNPAFAAEAAATAAARIVTHTLYNTFFRLSCHSFSVIAIGRAFHPSLIPLHHAFEDWISSSLTPLSYIGCVVIPVSAFQLSKGKFS